MVGNDNIFSTNILYKIVYKDEDRVKTLRAHIISNTTNYLTVKFEDTDKLKHVNHNVIITVTEVEQ